MSCTAVLSADSQVLMRGRSEYINALFSGAFQDCTAPATQEQNSVPVSHHLEQWYFVNL